jgi:HlyD family secretion protein/macrolide-specific efflux system membrane fusion protein
MTETRNRASWLVYALGALCAAAIVGAVLVVGPASGSQATVTRTAKVSQGVVQSTVSGSGNLQAASQLNLGFKTSGTVTNIYVKQGQQVVAGQLLATLDPQSAEVTLEQGKATLQSAEANLAKEEETDGESSSGGSGSSAGGSAGGTTASAASTDQGNTPAKAIAAAYAPTTTTPTSTTPASTPTSTSSTPAPTTTSPSTTTSPATRPSTTTTTTTTGKGTKGSREGTTTTSTEASPSTSSSSTSKTTISAATREANLASARAAVKSDKLTVQSDEQAVQNTKLYAPQDGTIVTLSGQVGETVSGTGTTKTSSSAGSSSGSSTTGAAATGARTGATGSSATGAASSSSSSTSSSSSFAVLSDLTSMLLVAPLSESEIGNVKVGQIATVTVEALSGAKLAAHVSEVATLSTSNSGVVSYDVTFQLDQLQTGLKPGMSATAEVVVKQAEGLNVPTSAITADTVTVERAAKQVRQRVVTGLAGDTSTIVLSGLKAGETVVLPAATVSSTSSTSVTSRRSGLGAAGGLGGAAGGLGGGGGAFFRGGG